ncbi:hypothetical protein EIK56_18250 [Sphingomonas sp. C8-2]|jgi:hypothetical protein|nr:hypothetical protein EIK56_18250 [Sphingomonas sp. C8-2]
MTGRFSIAADGTIIERAVSPAEERASHIHCARVYLNEARFRRINRGRYAGISTFHFALLTWAGNARRRAAAIDVRPAQMDMFA